MPAKHQKAIAVEEESGELDMSPMIDMVFLLLIFFIVNAAVITVKRDKLIAMPVASNGGEVKSANGAIVLSVYDPGSPEVAKAHPGLRWGDDEGRPLQDEAAVEKYIKEKVEQFAQYKEKPGLALYLRGDVNSIYKSSKTLIDIAGKQGVSKVMFATVKPKG